MRAKHASGLCLVILAGMNVWLGMKVWRGCRNPVYVSAHTVQQWCVKAHYLCVTTNHASMCKTSSSQRADASYS